MKSLSGFLFAVLALGSTAFAAMNGPTGLAVDASVISMSPTSMATPYRSTTRRTNLSARSATA